MTHEMISDEELGTLFSHIDCDDSGDLSIDELIEFVWGDDFEMSPRKHSPSPPRRERSGPHSARF